MNMLPPAEKKPPAEHVAGRGSLFTVVGNSLFFLSADRFLEGLAGRELGNLRRFDLDRRAGLRVSPHPGLPVAHAECPESRNNFV